MPLLTNRKLIENDPWLSIDPEQPLPAEGALIVPLAIYLEQADSLAQRDIAIRINGDDDFKALLAIKDKFELIIIDIPAFTDGRGFSFARILRREGFKGQIRACGDVTRDRLEFLERCGFDAFDIAQERYQQSAIESAFEEMSVNYQASADEPRPIFRR